MTLEEIRKWVEENATMQPNIPLAPEELDHIAMCMHHIWQWYFEGRPLGNFLTAVVQDKFYEAALRADDVNRKAFYLYALFLANKVGSDWIEKALGKKQGGE